MFCRQHNNISEIDMAIVLRIAVIFSIGSAIGIMRSTEARASTRMLQQQPVYMTDGLGMLELDDTQAFIESNSIQRYNGTSVARTANSLKRVFLSNRSITCNDGSQAGFYLRKPLVKSKRWVVFLEGGWHCYDTESCKLRWTKYRNLMTSAKWPETREDVGGLLSPRVEENPYWHDANHIFVPYCSSDSWSGTSDKPEEQWAFMGALIVRQVMTDLIPLGLGRSQGGELLMAGSSAGGLGVMLNLDRMKKFLREEREIKVTVRGISDSGWFLDREPFAEGAISSTDMVQLGHTLWDGLLPDACVEMYSSEPWRCYFGHRIYETMKAPLFVFQWLFDEAQMRADHVGTPVTKSQWDFIHDTGIALRDSLKNVTAVFAPSCVGHAVLTRNDWLNIKIDDYSLAETIRCWEHSTGRGNKDLTRRQASQQPEGGSDNGDKVPTKKRHQEHERRRQRQNERRRRKQQRQQERRERQLERHRLAREQQKRNERNKRRNGGQGGSKRVANSQKGAPQPNTAEHAVGAAVRAERSSTAGRDSEPKPQNGGGGGGKKRKNGPNSDRQRKQKRMHRQQQRQQQMREQRQLQQQITVPEPTRCNIRLLERCSWPQCNQSCPNLTNPLTGKEMRFLELLASFGLNIEAVATALGVNMTTLHNMDRSELVSMLTQTS